MICFGFDFDFVRESVCDCGFGCVCHLVGRRLHAVRASASRCAWCLLLVLELVIWRETRCGRALETPWWRRGGGGVVVIVACSSLVGEARLEKLTPRGSQN